jgi:hypothetical protein
MFVLRVSATATLALVFFLCSCSKTPTPPVSQGDAGKSSVAGEPVSGKTAFWEMHKAAHAWATDRVALSLESKTVPGVKNEPGKAAMWTATFGSPRKQEARTYTYSVAARAPDIIKGVKGVSVGGAISWSGPTHEALTIDTADFSVDSDSAYQTALAQSADWLKRHPDKEVSLALGNASRFDGPVWYVLWGDQKSGHAVYVSAKSGTVVK